MKKTVLLLVILALILLCCAAAADTLTLPASLTEIEEEAFMGDTSITEVVLPERLEVIGDRAFLGCVNLLEIDIPASVRHIGQDALPPQALVRCVAGSAAEEYAIDNGLDHASEGQYVIGDIWMCAENGFCLQVITGDFCTLRVELWDSGWETLYASDYAECAEYADWENRWFYFDEMPEYFVARFTLENQHGALLCEPVLWLDRTDPHPEFEGMQPEFFGGTVLNYGIRGFAVLREDVRTVSGWADGGAYAIQTDGEILPGDALYIANENALIKVGSVSEGDGVRTVQADSGAGLDSFFQYINYHATLDAARGLRDTEYAGGVQSVRGTAEVDRYTAELDLGAVTARATVGAAITCNLRYDASLFGSSYLECDLYAQTDAGVSLTAEAEYSFQRDWPLYTYSVPTDIPGLLITLDMSMPMELTARAEAEASAQINASLGFRYRTGHGFTPIQEGEARWDLKAEGEVTAQAGPKLTMGLSFLRMVTAGISAQAGCQFTASTAVEAHSDDEENPDRIHACDLCLDVAVNRYVSVDASLSALGISLEDHTLYGSSDPIFEGYLSVLSEEQSPLGGRMTLGEGECPNYKYRATLRVEDPDDPDTVKPAAIHRRINGTERELIAEGLSPVLAYLYPGQYAAESEYRDQPEYMNFTVTDQPVDLLMDFSDIPVDEAHFPDAGFRAYVADTYDLDGDMLLNAWERYHVTSMVIEIDKNDPAPLAHFPGSCSSFEGLGYFSELREFRLLDNDVFSHGASSLQALDLSLNARLERVELQGLPAAQLDVTGCAELQELSVLCARIAALDVSGCSALQNIHVQHCPNLTNLILGNHPAIVGIYADYCSLSDLDLSGCGGLRYLSIQGNRFTWLDLTPFPDIYTVWIADNPGMVLDISHKYSIHKWDYVPRSEWGVVYSSSALRDQTIYYKYAVYYRTEQGFWTFLPGFESVP